MGSETQIAVKERPIIFSGESLRGIIEGHKTQTRRVCVPTATMSNESRSRGNCPYGQPGDRLWVRERFQPIFAPGFNFHDVDWKTGHGYKITYAATDNLDEYMDDDGNLIQGVKPSIHMPRWASRLTLEILKVRVERVQEITAADARSEGAVLPTDNTGHALLNVSIHPKPNCRLWNNPKDATLDDYWIGYFAQLWDSINAKPRTSTVRGARGFDWASNPWVWVIEFRKL